METQIFITGAEKVSLIACMYEALRESLPGYFSIPDAKDFDIIDKAYRQLPTDASMPLTIALNGGKDRLSFKFSDNMKGARIFLYILDDNSDPAELMKAAESIKDSALFLLIPTKTGLYTAAETSHILSQTASKFGAFVELLRTKYRGRACAAILPVRLHGGREDADQPLRFAVSYMLNQGMIPASLQEQAKTVADGALLNDERFSVLCGHELLEPTPRKKGGHSWKFAAVIALACVVAGAGGYYTYRRAKRRVQAYELTAIESQKEAEEGISAAKSSEQKAIRERNQALADRAKAIREREAAIRERDTAIKTADRLQKENDQLRAQLEELRRNYPDEDGFLSGALKKIGL